MTVVCPGCRRPIRVPPEKETTPDLQARCGVCGYVFAVASAERWSGETKGPGRPPGR